jgi:DnaJ-class molecular chaperone
MRDPYEVLGVARNANAGEVKSAFRRLAKKLHPDANKHDPKAAARFAELNAAYEILGEDDKRKAFDRGEIDAEGKPRFRGFEGFGAGPGPGGGYGREGQFETFTWGPEGFRRSTGRRGSRGFGGGFEDILKDMFSGAGRSTRAGGDFGTEFDLDDLAGQTAGRDVTATLTITLEEAAKSAKKRVRLPTGKDVDVKVPAGLSSGQQIRLKGQGLPGPGGAVGDALVTVIVAPHAHFRPDGADLRLDLPISLDEAVLGAKVRVPTLDGAVELAIPSGTSSGRTFRLKGKGLPAKSGKGDLLATVRIMLPDGKDPELEELMRKWRDGKSYDPRRDMS